MGLRVVTLGFIGVRVTDSGLRVMSVRVQEAVGVGSITTGLRVVTRA